MFAVWVALWAFSTVGVAAANEGKALHDEHCIACHANMFDGDPYKIYTRTDRTKSTLKSLKQMVAFCNNQVGSQWFDEEVDQVTDYLNSHFYKLDQ
uniref:Cytochrome c domain-containing protein n=1 Tax=Magnetococcus massalia (strain MO-1) TaxID=451514 RepID=A0A1S7LMK2_MAGMO|nr:Conserved exported protein of unknown function [Candidatus Magnetococcus massalia]